MEFDQIVGARLRYYRLESGRRADDVSDALAIAVDAYRDMEAGRTRLPAAKLLAASRLLGFTMVDFFDGVIDAAADPAAEAFGARADLHALARVAPPAEGETDDT